MTTIQNILFPVDYSPSCTAMAPSVKKAAAVFSAKVTLLYVLEPFASGFEPLARPLPEAEKDRKQVARAKLKSFLESTFPTHNTQRVLIEGDAATRIVEVATDRHFDLITMPTHAGTFWRMLLGSTTAKVLNDADCPVLTTQHAQTISPRPLEHREWVCALGLQPDSQRVPRYASRVAESVHAKLTLIHAIPAAEPGAAFRLDLDERVQADERHAARRLEELQGTVGSRAPVRIVIGPVKDALTEAARRLEADLLVIGRGPQASASCRLRDLSYAGVRDAPCPVLSV